MEKKKKDEKIVNLRRHARVCDKRKNGKACIDCGFGELREVCYVAQIRSPRQQSESLFLESRTESLFGLPFAKSVPLGVCRGGIVKTDLALAQVVSLRSVADTKPLAECAIAS